MINWLKHNWAVVILILIAFTWLKNNSSVRLPASGGGISSPMLVDNVDYSFGSAKMMPGHESAPTDTTNRLVIQNSSLSLQVKDVAADIKAIESIAQKLGGYLVNSNLSRPDSAASGSITVRVPETARPEALEGFKKLAVKVVSESVSGFDVTDQYVDLEAQLEVLLKTKVKYEEILSRATLVSDLMNVQQQLTSLQQQIDNIKGQQKYYEQSAKLTKITIYLSTDELALPYAPTNEWRPTVVFKEAVRSLIGNIRNIGNLLIWSLVYIPIIVPIGLLLWYIKRRSSSHT